MKLPEFEKCKCCKIRKLNNGDIRLCCVYLQTVRDSKLR